MSSNKSKLALLQDDPWLNPYEQDLENRLSRFKEKLSEIEQEYGSLITFSNAYKYLGFNYDKVKKGWWYREWAPRAKALFLIGDFNNWDRKANPLQRNQNGVWELFLADNLYENLFIHTSLVKVLVVGENEALDRLPAYIQRTLQNPDTHDFSAQHWAPKNEFEWTDQHFQLSSLMTPYIYECHVGMAQEKEGLGTYREFAENVLPRIKQLGYNSIQMMAIQEHPYYGSFGYHVSNFFAPSSRFGTPEDLKYLINKAHEMGIAIIMDLVHSHAVKNIAEGLNGFDGTDDQYFHPGDRGYHSAWDSRLFNYGKKEVQQFLLSNLAYWLNEFHIDGFRFDGVTSMLYFHHGHYISFDHYDKYFKEDVEWDAITYLQLANKLIHEIKPNAIVIAEDMSGMPGMCRKIEEGGIGFDYRLGMGIPDYWIKILKHLRDEDWDIYEMWNVLTNRRYKEKTIAYAESHDQALVGDKTLAFWLMDKEMYWHMHIDDQNPIIDRGIALHKLIRLFTLSLGGDAYLNFIGNEFGHPEWIDFPRAGNDWSYKYARRQWSLVDNEDLKYKYLWNFDKAMIHLASENQVSGSLPARQINMDAENKIVVFERNNLIFVFSFQPDNSLSNYEFEVPEPGNYKIIFNSDRAEFGGFNRIDENLEYITDENGKLRIYITNRTALIFKRS